MLPSRRALVLALWRLDRSFLPLYERFDLEQEAVGRYCSLVALDRVRRMARLGPPRPPRNTRWVRIH